MLSTSRTRSLVIVVACLAVAACGSTSAPGASVSSSTPSTGASATSPTATSPTATTATSATPSTQTPTPVDRDPLTHKLLAEDFAQGPGVFHVGTLNGYTYSIKHGTYVVTASSTPKGMAQTYGEFARVAYVIDSSVDVIGAESSPSDTVVGLGCFDAAGKYGLVMLAATDGAGGYYFRVVKGVADTDPLATWSTPPTAASPVTSLRLLAAVTNPLDDHVRLSAWVNGVAVPETPETDRFDGCSGMVLFVGAPKKGLTISFDNARAIVPGE